MASSGLDPGKTLPAEVGEGLGPEFAGIDWTSEYSEFERDLARLSGAGLAVDWEAGLSVPQLDVFRCPARWRVLAAGRRFGKTFLAGRVMLALSQERARVRPDPLVWYLAPTYRQAKQALWRTLKRMSKPYWLRRPNETELSIELRWGATVALRGADNYDALRGPGLDGCVLDEYATMAPEAWTEVIRPALSDRLGIALFIGTPKGFNHFHELYQVGRAGALDWAAFQYTTLDGGRVPPEEIEAARRELDEKTFRQEYEARFESIAVGLVYYAFDRVRDVGVIEFDRRQPLCWSLDFNVDPMCSVLGQVVDGKVRLLREMVLPDSSTFQACERFLKASEPFFEAIQPDLGVVRLRVNVYGDASGRARRSSSDKTDWQIVREFFSRNSDRFDASFRVETSNPEIRARVNSTNALICNHAGERRLIIDPSCRNLIADFERVSWKKDGAGNPTGDLDKSDPKRTHVSDASGYLIYREFGLRQKNRERSEGIGF